jgi:hypothetical protein
MSKVKHIVLLKFKEGITQEQIDTLFAEILDLTENVPGVEDYVAGTNNSPEGLNKGFTHGFVMTFTDAQTRDAYLNHADHQRVKAQILEMMDDGLAFDFEL